MTFSFNSFHSFSFFSLFFLLFMSFPSYSTLWYSFNLRSSFTEKKENHHYIVSFNSHSLVLPRLAHPATLTENNLRQSHSWVHMVLSSASWTFLGVVRTCFHKAVLDLPSRIYSSWCVYCVIPFPALYVLVDGILQ
jgi:hypothetical protein